MTNQPRSSRVAAELERPAPDIPATIRYSAIGLLAPPRVGRPEEFSHRAWAVLEAQHQQARDRPFERRVDRGGEELDERRRLLHRRQQEVARRERVDVAREGPVGEVDPHPGVHLLGADALGEVGPDAPVALAEDLVVDEAAAGPVVQGVVDEEQEAPAGLEDPGDLVEHRVGVAGVLDHQAADDRVEARVGEGQPLALGLQVARAAARGDGVRELARATGRSRRPPAGRLPTRRGAGRPGPRRSRCRGRGGCRRARASTIGRISRLVLGVGALGERRLPPLGLLVPRMDRGAPAGAGRRRVSGAHAETAWRRGASWCRWA